VEFQEFIKKVGNNAKSLRLKQCLTQEAMEKGEFPVALRTVQDIETGKSNASLRSIYKIAKKLKVHPKDLLNVK